MVWRFPCSVIVISVIVCTCKVIFNMAVMCFRRRKYTKDEDMRIWKYVRDRRENGVRLAGNSFWKQMENERVKWWIKLFVLNMLTIWLTKCQKSAQYHIDRANTIGLHWKSATTACFIQEESSTAGYDIFLVVCLCSPIGDNLSKLDVIEG